MFYAIIFFAGHIYKAQNKDSAENAFTDAAKLAGFNPQNSLISFRPSDGVVFIDFNPYGIVFREGYCRQVNDGWSSI